VDGKMKHVHSISEITIYAVSHPKIFLVALRQKSSIWVYWAGGQLRWTHQLIAAAVGDAELKSAIG
jgi:hypothetical protein